MSSHIRRNLNLGSSSPQPSHYNAWYRKQPVCLIKASADKKFPNINFWNFSLEASLVNQSLMQLCRGSYILICVAWTVLGEQKEGRSFPRNWRTQVSAIPLVPIPLPMNHVTTVLLKSCTEFSLLPLSTHDSALADLSNPTPYHNCRSWDPNSI